MQTMPVTQHLTWSHWGRQLWGLCVAVDTQSSTFLVLPALSKHLHSLIYMVFIFYKFIKYNPYKNKLVIKCAAKMPCGKHDRWCDRICEEGAELIHMYDTFEKETNNVVVGFKESATWKDLRGNIPELHLFLPQEEMKDSNLPSTTSLQRHRSIAATSRSCLLPRCSLLVPSQPTEAKCQTTMALQEKWFWKSKRWKRLNDADPPPKC